MNKIFFLFSLSLLSLSLFGCSSALKDPVFTEADANISFSYPSDYASQDLKGQYVFADQATDADLGVQLKALFTRQGQDPFTVFVWNQAFDLANIRSHFAPTGMEDHEPSLVKMGAHDFYEYTGGNQMVNHPDFFFVDLNGQTLVFKFDGPYNQGETSPNTEAKAVEEKVLSSFAVLN